MSAITSHPRFDLSKLLFSGKTMCRSIPLPRATTSWLIILIALVAFEVFNFSTTEFALTDVLGDLSFAGWHWATILAVAFCAMDFAGIARLFGSPQGKDQPAELWYLLGAWLLAATMNAILTWWAVSLALLEHGQLGNEILARETLIRTVPIFVAILVWLLRVLLIGTFSLSMHTKRNVPVEPIKGQPGQASSRGELAGESGHPSPADRSGQPLRPAPKPSSPPAGRPEYQPALARSHGLRHRGSCRS
jgi:hypothetical protein